MASFRKRGELQWQARVARKGFLPQVKTFNTKPEAEAWAATIESTMAHGTFVSSAESERTTFGEALDRYQRERTMMKKGAAPERSRVKKLLGHPLARRLRTGRCLAEGTWLAGMSAMAATAVIRAYNSVDLLGSVT